MNMSLGGLHSLINIEMKLLVLCCLVAAVAAAPPPVGPGDVQILKYDFDNNVGPYGYRYAFDQSDGYKAEAQGELINEGKENAALVVKGSYQYVGQDGVLYTVTYVADEGGYQPTIEQGPGGAIPAAIIASLNG